MVEIVTEKADVREAINILLSGIEETGGGVHSKIQIVEDESGLGISTTEEMRGGRELIRISRGSVLPSDRYSITIKDDAFVVKPSEELPLSDVQKRMIEAKIELYNVTKKLEWHKKVSFFYGLRKFPDLIDAVCKVRTMTDVFKDRIDLVRSDMSAAQEEGYLVDTFLKTRHLGYSDHVRMTSVGIIMPVIDFINHHWSGAGFGSVGSARAGDISVNTAFPVEGSLETYAHYGTMDALDTLIRYDFPDVLSPVVRSVPFRYKLSSGQTLVVKSSVATVRADNSKVAADLKVYMPDVTYKRKENEIVLSHLFIPVRGAPLALRRVLKNALLMWPDAKISEEQVLPLVQELEVYALDLNIAEYSALLAEAKKCRKDSGGNAVLEMLCSAVESQLEALDGYSYGRQAA